MADVNAPSGQTPTMAPPDTIQYDKKAGCYKCQLDEQWFDLTKETLREALQITPVNHNQAFAAPPSIDGLIDFVNQLGYPKLVINLSNRKHMFYPRPDSPLHLSSEEPVLGYLKFSAKGTKSEVFEIPIPDSLITAEIQQATYYREYLANVTHHRKYLAGKTGGVQNPPAPKPTQPTKKPKAPTRPSISIPVASTQPAPTSALAKSQENKHKQATETTDKPAKAKRIKYSTSRKTRQPRSSPKSVGASEAEEVPAEEPQGPLPPVVIREPESGKYQPLPEVPGKGKAKVTEEHVAHDLLSLQKHKKTSLADQYIFQGRSNNEEESEKVVLGAEEGGQDEDQAGPDLDAQAEDQTAGPDPGDAEAKVQSISSPVVYAGSDREHIDLDVANVSPQPSTEQLDEGFTATVYPNVQDNLKPVIEEPVLLGEPASSSGTLSSLQHLSRDFSFGDQFFSDKLSDANKNAETEVESMVNVTIQQALSSISLITSPIIDLTSRPESPKEHQQLKATTTDTTTTTTSLPPPQSPQQSMTEAMMVKHIGELEHILADLIQINKNMDERLDQHGARLYTLGQLDILQQVSIAINEVVTDAVDWAMQAPLRNRFRDLPEADMKEILHQRMWESDSYKSHEDHMQLFEALEKLMNRDHSEKLAQDLAEARKKKKKSRESPKTPPGSPSHQPPPLPPPAGPSGALGAPRASGSAQMPASPPPPSSTNQESPSKGSAAPSPSKTAASAEYQAWMTTDIRLRPSISLTPADLEMDEDMAPDEQAQSSDDEEIESAHILTVNLR
nr:histone deacetylase 14 [Tanacetum cinerariifolium]